jgi:hypothetical protein
MRLRPRLCWAAAAAAAVAVAALAFGAADVGASTDPAGGAQLLDGMRRAVAGHDFRGVMVVQWTGADGKLHRQTVPVRNEDGALSVQGMEANVGTGPSEIVHGDDHALVMWSEAEDRAVPSATRKYDLTVAAGPHVAGRSTTVVEARLGGEKHPSARYYLDTATGLLLRSQEFDPGGRLVRGVSFVEISDPVTASVPDTTAAPSGSYAARATRAVAKPFHAPEHAGHGYALVGRYVLPSGTVQLFYSDGLFDISVFQQKGRLDWGGLPSGGVDTKVAGRTARQYVIPGGRALVWDARGVVYTCVTDAPQADVAAFVAAFPTNDGSGWDDAVDVVLAPFSW